MFAKSKCSTRTFTSARAFRSQHLWHIRQVWSCDSSESGWQWAQQLLVRHQAHTLLTHLISPITQSTQTACRMAWAGIKPATLCLLYVTILLLRHYSNTETQQMPWQHLSARPLPSLRRVFIISPLPNVWLSVGMFLQPSGELPLTNELG